MGAVISTIIAVLFCLAIVSMVIGQFAKIPAKARGADKCRHCGARLKSDPKRYGRYMAVCAKCGRDQTVDV